MTIIIIVADSPHPGSRRTSTPIDGTEMLSSSHSVCENSIDVDADNAEIDIGDNDTESNEILLKPRKCHSFCLLY